MTIQKCGNPSFGAKLVIDKTVAKNGLVMRVQNRLAQSGGNDIAYKVYKTKTGNINFIAQYLPSDSIVLSSCQVENKRTMVNFVKSWAKEIPILAGKETLRLASKV